MYETKEMRIVLAELLEKKMMDDQNIVVLDADLARAHGTLELRNKFPTRALDVGVAEANMMCVAAGLSSYGYKPFVYSFSPFVTRRACDQTAISVAYAKQNVKLVGSDPGISAELNGGTHMSVEDIGVMRSIPTMVIFEPVDGDQLAKAFPQIVEYKGPVYIRLYRKVAPQTFFSDENYEFDLFSADMMKEGKDVTLFATGIEVKEAMLAVEELENQGISAEVINIHTIKPLDEAAVIASIKKTGCAVTCENHNVVGGLYSAVTECLAKNKPVPVECIGINDHFGEVGKMPYLIDQFKMSAKYIAEAAVKVVERKRGN